MTASGKFLIITHFLSCGKKSDTLICTKNSDISTYVLTQKTNIYIFCSDSDIKGPKISGKSIFCKSEVHLFHDKSKETTLTKNIVPLWRFQFLFIFDREVRSGLSMSFFLLLLHRPFRQILILDKKTGKSHLGWENWKVLSWIRKPKSLILDKKTKKSHLR